MRSGIESLLQIRPPYATVPSHRIRRAKQRGAMKNYRLVMLNSNRQVLGSKTVACPTDGDAIATAEKLFGSAARIEVWDDDRPVCLCFNPDAERSVG